MTVSQILIKATWSLIQETGTGGFCTIVFTDEAYDKLVSELGAQMFFHDKDGYLSQQGISIQLGDGPVLITRQSKYMDEGRLLRESP